MSNNFNEFSITVLATGSYQNGSATITIPDLRGVPGMFAVGGSGTSVTWGASLSGGTGPEVHFLPSLTANGSVASVSKGGQYTVP